MSEENIKVNKEEGKSKKREWIKNIAIIFLSIMLLLTFFSNTIMNRTLPQVSTQYVQDGIIESQVRGTGRVEAIDPYSVTLQETRTIASVVKKEGEHVEAGDVIYKLQGEESEELIKAREELDDLQVAYEKAIVSNGLTRNEVAMIENGNVTSVSSTQATIEGYDSKLKNLENELINLKAQKTTLELQKNSIQDAGKINTSDLRNAKGDKEYALGIQTDALANIEDKESEEYKAMDKQIKQLKEEIRQIEKAIADAENKDSINTTNVENQRNNLQVQIDNVNAQIESKTAEAERIKNDKTDSATSYTNVLDAAAAYKKIQNKKAEVEKLEAKALGGEITAPVAGTLTTLSYTAGEKTVAGEAAAVIQIDGKGYKTSFPVSIKQANAINVGDNVTLVDAWMLGDAKANLVSITKDKDKPGENKILNFELNGDQVQDGMNITLSVGEKSSRYEYIVPNAAIKEDNNGKFVLILQSKSTPFGNRYMAERTDVEVLAKDDKNTAISGNIGSYEYVILTSSKPIKSGDQVRMAE